MPSVITYPGVFDGVYSPIVFSRASSGTYFNSAGVLTTAATNAPRIDYNPSTLVKLGMLIEEARTNSLRNNMMVGAVAGTPGTLPTNWQGLGAGLGTLTQTIVGTGTSAGITYIDIRINGTTSTTSYGIGFESFTQIAASVGQTWTSSFYVARVGGSTTNLTNIYNRVIDRDGVGTNLGSSVFDFLPTLSTTLTRTPLTRTLALVGTTAVSNDVLFAFNSGVAIDITLRIGLPQLEQGAFATSVIPTTTAAVTRSADVASVNTLSPWYNATEGTLYAEWATATTDATNNRGIAALDDGSLNNRVAMFVPNSFTPPAVAARVVSGGTATNPANAGSIALSSTAKTALTYGIGTDQAALCVNGGTPTTASPVAAPVGVNTLRIGAILGVTQLGGYIRRITYYPTGFTNAQLQALTA